MGVKLQKMTLANIYSNLDKSYNILSENRVRLKPWFWWADEKVIPSKAKFAWFVLLYLFDTKHKKLMHALCDNVEYDEQFFILVDDKFGGMIGLDNINDWKQNAELWCWVDKKYESKGIAGQAIKIIEDYSLNQKGIKCLYAKIAFDNMHSTYLANSNNFDAVKIEYGIRTSKHNPKITNIITWEKQLAR